MILRIGSEFAGRTFTCNTLYAGSNLQEHMRVSAC